MEDNGSKYFEYPHPSDLTKLTASDLKCPRCGSEMVHDGLDGHYLKCKNPYCRLISW